MLLRERRAMTSHALTLVETRVLLFYLFIFVGCNGQRVLSFYWRDASPRVLAPALTALRSIRDGPLYIRTE